MAETVETHTEENEGILVRVAALAAVIIACMAVAVIVLSSSDKYTVKAHFQSGGQLVKGNLVLSAGRKVGVVKSVELTDNGLAEVILEIEDGGITPLREGTEATIRQASQSSVAGRYVDLHLAPAGGSEIPEGGEIPEERTTTAVDIDQLFALFDERTRKGLTNVIRGSAAQYEGRGEETNAGWRYLNPSLIASTRLFAELDRDDELLERFVVASSRLVTDVAERRDDLASLIDGLATTTGAIAQERTSLSNAISQLPPFMRRANSTFVNLRQTLDEADPLVEESKPVARRLRPVLAQLRAFSTDARPTVRDLADVVRRPGPRNDLIELGHATLPFRDIAIGPVRANGETRRGSFAESAESLAHQTPHWGFQRPYAVDLTGWFDDFSHSGLYDANGSASRVATSVPAFRVVEGQVPQLTFVDYDQRAAVFRELAMIGQNNRCPGSAERNTRDNSNPWRPTSTYNCDPNHVPIGP